MNKCIDWRWSYKYSEKQKQTNKNKTKHTHIQNIASVIMLKNFRWDNFPGLSKWVQSYSPSWLWSEEEPAPWMQPEPWLFSSKPETMTLGLGGLVFGRRLTRDMGLPASCSRGPWGAGTRAPLPGSGPTHSQMDCRPSHFPDTCDCTQGG